MSFGFTATYSNINHSCPFFFQDDETGKPVVNFQDERSIAILTKCLLHKDFDLKVDFPVNRLIPTLPLRLNYILWIEDILNTFGIKDGSGIDIGGFCDILRIFHSLTSSLSFQVVVPLVFILC